MEQDTALLGLGLGLFLIGGFFLWLIFHIFYSFCFLKICQRLGDDPGFIIWIPILQFIPIFKIGDMNPLWLLLLIGFVIPLVNFVATIAFMVVSIIVWYKICEKRGKPGWLVVLFFLPIVNLLVIPYLAFSE